MLQLSKFYQQCFHEFYNADQLNKNIPEDLNKIKLKAFLLFKRISERKSELKYNNFFYFLDNIIWSNKIEHIDNPSFNIETKKKIIHGLHLKNTIFGTYNKTMEILAPLIDEIYKRENRPVRILELGSGLGKLTMEIYKKTEHFTIPIELTGSDIISEYIDTANIEATKKNYNLKFKVIDAFHLEKLEPNSYDIIFTLHSMHHFSPEQLTIIMSGSQKVATKAFVGIDGYRGIGNLLFMAITGAFASLCNFDFCFFHDSLLSGRKMYSAKQLEIMARIGCSTSKIITKHLRPGLTVIKIITNR